MILTEEVDEYVGRIREITAEKGRIEAELNLAAQIQTQMVPAPCPEFDGRNDIRLFANSAHVSTESECRADGITIRTYMCRYYD